MRTTRVEVPRMRRIGALARSRRDACGTSMPFVDEHLVPIVVSGHGSFIPTSLTHVVMGSAEGHATVQYRGSTHSAAWHAREWSGAALRHELLRPRMRTACAFYTAESGADVPRGKEHTLLRDGRTSLASGLLAIRTCSAVATTDSNVEMEGKYPSRQLDRVTGPCFLFIRKIRNASFEHISLLRGRLGGAVPPPGRLAT